MNTFLHPITEHTSVTEGAKLLCVGGVAARSVLHTDGRTAFIIEIDQKIIAPRFADDLGAVQGVNMLNTADGFARADAVGVVTEFHHQAGFLHLLQLPSVPGQ